ncbi:ATP-binding protein [Lachnospiraceae bacterium LCP25S3_G4]
MDQLDTTLQRMKALSENSQDKDALGTSKSSKVCEVCGGSGWISYEDEKGRVCARPCACREKMIMNNRLRFADIPVTFKNMTLETFELGVYEKEDSKVIIKGACNAIKYYLINFEDMKKTGMGLYIYSNTKGSGKTRMVASIANDLMGNKNQQVKFAVSTTILNEIKRCWDDECKSESKLLDSLSTTPVPIIDDFGTEKVKDWISEKFYHIINERYIGNKVTIFTSNYSLDTLQCDDRITNRIKEKTYQIAFPEESVRDAIASKNQSTLISKMTEGRG